MDTKEALLGATVALLRGDSVPQSLGVRAITQRAGAATGAVNYHFGSKEGLIREACARFIAEVLRDSPERLAGEIPPQAGPAGSRAAFIRILDGLLWFLVRFPGASRVSILNDLEHPSKDDNTARMAAWFARTLAPSAPDEADAISRVLVSHLQATFLRREAEDWNLRARSEVLVLVDRFLGAARP